MTYPEALQYLDSLINYEKRDDYNYNKSFKLERMRKLASLLGDPQKSTKSIHVAGSKGKGSTSAFVHSVLKSAGFRTGLYTSPHLVSFRERIRINDSLISEEDIARLLADIRDVLEEKMGDDRPTLFEVYTALAYLYFKEKRTDFAVYEVGLGGRLDATNLIEPLVSAITPISYEHTHILGNRLSEIALEKCGIIKDGSICVVAPQSREALDVIEVACRERGAKMVLVGRDVLFEELSADDRKEHFSVFGLFAEYPILETALLGSHQVVNAATAVGIVEALRLRGIMIPADAVRNGIASCRWEGRMELISKNPSIVLDGAQNRASASALAKAIKRTYRYKRLILALGVSKDKDIAGILEELLPIADSVVLTKSRVAERASDPAGIKDLIDSKDKEVVLTANVEEALEKARRAARPDDLILVTGSLFVVGEAREICVNRF